MTMILKETTAAAAIFRRSLLKAPPAAVSSSYSSSSSSSSSSSLWHQQQYYGGRPKKHGIPLGRVASSSSQGTGTGTGQILRLSTSTSTTKNVQQYDEDDDERRSRYYYNHSSNRNTKRNIVLGDQNLPQSQQQHRYPLLLTSSIRQFSSEAAAHADASTAAGTASADAAAAATGTDGGELSSPKVQGLYDRIEKLPSDEVNVLGALILQMLGRTIFPGEFGGANGGAGGVAAGVAAGGGGDAAPVEEEAKTIFDLKLVGFDAKAKIKVIKEVRSIAGLGLKEAKTLVEEAPKIVQKGLKQDKADELKAQLEAVGAEIEIV